MKFMAEIKYWREEKRTMLKDVVPLDIPYNIGKMLYDTLQEEYSKTTKAAGQ